MRKVKLSSVLAMVLSAFMLITSLPMAAFAVTPTIGTGAGTPNYDDYRGSGMTADAKGVMIYNDLAQYHKQSEKDVRLSTDYETVTSSTANTKTSVSSTATYSECPYLYADYAIYYDETIKGNTIKIRYGLSMMDSVEYVDANGDIVKSDKSPIELSASYKNDANPNYNAGYGMVYDEEGNHEYTTRYYREKAIIFYVINHTSYERIGQEDDVSILKDYIAQGYVVVTVDFKSHANATSPISSRRL